MSKFKVGDPVVPVSKSVGSGFENSGTWNRAKERNQPFLFVVDFLGNAIVCDVNINSESGDFFLESDLIPFEEVAARIEPKEKAPVWYTLPAPVAEQEEPDYKGFYTFMKKYGVEAVEACDICPCQKDFCMKYVKENCTEILTLYAENKFIKRGK